MSWRLEYATAASSGESRSLRVSAKLSIILIPWKFGLTYLVGGGARDALVGVAKNIPLTLMVAGLLLFVLPAIVGLICSVTALVKAISLTKGRCIILWSAITGLTHFSWIIAHLVLLKMGPLDIWDGFM